MKNKDVSVPAEAMDIFDNSVAKYKSGGIEIAIVDVNGSDLKIRVKQTRKDTDKVLTNRELYDRAKEAAAPIAPFYTIYILPVVWSGAEIDTVSASWVHAKMAKHKLKQADLCDMLMVDKHVMSKLLSNEFTFTRWHKAAFYYLFQSMEVKG